MTQEDKNLLIKDLCARFPYNVVVKYGVNSNINLIVTEISGTERINNIYSIEFCKPYLFPMYSMTEEQKIKYAHLWEDYADRKYDIIFNGNINYDVDVYKLPVDYQIIDWLNVHHFDYRGLIEKGLAIDATNLNIY